MWREHPREPPSVPAAFPVPGCRRGAGAAAAFPGVAPFPPPSSISRKSQTESLRLPELPSRHAPFFTALSDFPLSLYQPICEVEMTRCHAQPLGVFSPEWLIAGAQAPSQQRLVQRGSLSTSFTHLQIPARHCEAHRCGHLHQGCSGKVRRCTCTIRTGTNLGDLPGQLAVPPSWQHPGTSHRVTIPAMVPIPLASVQHISAIRS